MTTPPGPTNRATPRRLSWPRALLTIAAVVGAGMLVAQLPELFAALGSMTTPAPILLPLGLSLVVIGAFARAFQLGSASRVCGVESSWTRDLELSARTYATNRVVKSGGVAGLLHHLADADRHNRSRRAVTLAYGASRIADMVAFGVMTAVAVGLGAATGVLSGPLLVAGAATLGYACLQIAVLWIVVRHPQRAFRVLDRTRVAYARLRRRSPRASDTGVSDDLAELVTVLRSNPRTAFSVLAGACISKLAGLSTLMLVVVGLRLAIDPTSIPAIFVLGLAAAMLGPLPGGLGTTEASLAALLGTAGVAAGAAAGAVLAFRLFDFWLPTIIGFTVTACASSRPHARRAPHHREGATWSGSSAATSFSVRSGDSLT